MTMPDGKTTNYAYDANNRLTQIIADVTQSFSFTYNSLNRRTSLLYPNAMQTTYTYDAKGNLTDILTQKALTTYKQTYQYDKTGNRTTYTEPNAAHTYTYDPTYQLVSADHTNIPDETYAYDPVGNRLTTTVDAANRLTQDATYTYTYDNNGNLIQKRRKLTGVITQYTYDYENRLIRINLPLGITVEYKYDPLGRRIEKNISGQITAKYIYDSEDIIIEYTTIIPTNTTITTKYIHGPGIDEPLAMIRNNKTYYYHADALGSIIRMTDQNANTAQTIRYDTFGNIKSISNPLLIQPYTYTGREFDIESGFYYMRNRYYDPKTGRFTTKDPIGFNGGDVNLFRYVGNNPVNDTDPYGLIGIDSVLKWLGKQPAKQIGKWFGKNIGKPDIDTTYEGDDDGDGIPNFQDTDSEYCQMSYCKKAPQQCK
jgi:RHS repeat-associated protein